MAHPPARPTGAGRSSPPGWSAAEQLTTPGNNTWPAADGGVVVFTTDRAATRTQHDVTQEVHQLRAHGR
ncbi:hypothetical protein [Nonomuraea maritima]|uniref:hypothetical protein n=1 Tax=Nonomuraea maritima TaxID=683260 RepID=UPI00115FFB6C|nr:hypothetical protein [Nonomuraea maritima]